MKKTFGNSIPQRPLKEYKTDPDIQEEIKRKDLEDKIKKEKELKDQYNKGVRNG